MVPIEALYSMPQDILEDALIIIIAKMQPDMDFFAGAVYTYYPYYGYIQATNTEGRPYVSTINSYRSHICNRRSFHGFKVISRQRQLQSTHNSN